MAINVSAKPLKKGATDILLEDLLLSMISSDRLIIAVDEDFCNVSIVFADHTIALCNWEKEMLFTFVRGYLSPNADDSTLVYNAKRPASHRECDSNLINTVTAFMNTQPPHITTNDMKAYVMWSYLSYKNGKELP